MSYFDIAAQGELTNRKELLLKDNILLVDNVNNKFPEFYQHIPKVFRCYIAAARVDYKQPIIDQTTGDITGYRDVYKIFKVGKYLEVEHEQTIIINNGLDVYTTTLFLRDIGYGIRKNNFNIPDGDQYTVNLYCEKITLKDAFYTDLSWLDVTNPDNILDDITEAPPDEIIEQQQDRYVMLKPRYKRVSAAEIETIAGDADVEIYELDSIGVTGDSVGNEISSQIGLTRYNNYSIFRGVETVTITGVIRVTTAAMQDVDITIAKLNLGYWFLKDVDRAGFNRVTTAHNNNNKISIRFFGEKIILRVNGTLTQDDYIVFTIIVPRYNSFTIVDGNNIPTIFK